MTTGAERSTYRELFGTPEFSAVFAAQVVSMLGTMVADVALTVLVYSRTGSPLLAAATYTVGFLPFLIGGALLSGLVDRLPTRVVLVTCDLVAASLFGLMTIPHLPIAALFGFEFVAGLVAPVFAASKAAILPGMLGEGSKYILGRSVMRIVSQGSQVIGFAVGGVLVATIGARYALAADAASFVGSAVLLRFGTRRRPPAAANADSLVKDSIRGMRAVLSHGDTRRLLLLGWLIPTCGVAPEALAAPYIAHLHHSQSAIGIYLAAIPIGMVAADFVVGRFLSTSAQRRVVLPASILTAVPLLAFAFTPSLPVVLALLVPVGLGYSYSLPLEGMLLQTAPLALRNRAFAVENAGLMFLQGVGFLIWGAVGEALPVGPTVAVAGGCALATALFLGPRVISAARPAPAPPAFDRAGDPGVTVSP